MLSVLRKKSVSPIVCLAASAIILAGCQGKPFSLGGGDKMTTASTNAQDAAPSFRKTGELSKAWEKDKGNAAIGLAYAENLGQFGQRPAQVEVLSTVAGANPTNAEVQAKAGKALLAAGASGEAVAVLQRAVELNPNDWQSRSALGSAFDQKGQHGEARAQYEAALQASPGNVGVQNNLAMSYALQGKLPEAEAMLRKLLDGDGKSNPRVRQNLALVIGLQGRFDDAKRVASEDLPPDQVEANMAYLQQMLAQPNTWAKLQEG